MSLSQAYGGTPSYTILSIGEFKKDMEKMGVSDKLVRDYCSLRVDDDLQLMDLIATIKNLPVDKNDSNPAIHPVLPVPSDV